MILTPQDLRKVRPIANNINDLARVEPYISEAETLRAIDVLGARLYEWLANTKFEPGKVYPFYLEGSPLDTTEPTPPDPEQKEGEISFPDFGLIPPPSKILCSLGSAQVEGWNTLIPNENIPLKTEAGEDSGFVGKKYNFRALQSEGSILDNTGGSGYEVEDSNIDLFIPPDVYREYTIANSAGLARQVFSLYGPGEPQEISLYVFAVNAALTGSSGAETISKSLQGEREDQLLYPGVSGLTRAITRSNGVLFYKFKFHGDMDVSVSAPGDGYITAIALFVYPSAFQRVDFLEQTFDGTRVEMFMDNGTGSTNPTYYANGEALRFYNGNTLKVSVANNPDPHLRLAKIELIMNGENASTMEITADLGEYDSVVDKPNGVWTGEAPEVTFTFDGKNHRKMSGIKVWYLRRVPADPRKKIEVDGDNVIKALDGGYWTDKCGCYKQSPGLKNAIAYLAYSRFLINNPVNPTAFGVVYKDGEFSTKVEDSILVRTAAEASKIGEAYLSKALEYFRHLGLLPECKTTPGAPSRNLIIRRHKL